MALSAAPNLSAALAIRGPGSKPNTWVRPSQVASKWTIVVAAADVDDVDNATMITNPASQITDQNRITTVEYGSQVVFQLGYDDALAAIVDPQIQVFGRGSSAEHWTRLRNKDEESTITLITDSTNDITDGTLKYTEIDENAYIVDLLGCNQFIVGIVVKLNGTGTTSNAIIQAKAI